VDKHAVIASTTIWQRAGTNATFLNNPSADTPFDLFPGFDLTRRV